MDFAICRTIAELLSQLNMKKSILSWLQLARWNNLLIIFFTQLLIWWCVIQPIQTISKVGFSLDFFSFLLLSFSTILIAGAGYVINDYFDVKIDNINHPEKMVLEKFIPRKQAIIIHTILNVIAVLMASFVAKKSGHLSFAILQIISSVLLWFYSTHFKRQFLNGNLIVSFLTALTILEFVIYENALHPLVNFNGFIPFHNERYLPNPVWVLIVYAYFAFVLNWVREIVKDMEDFKGDEAEGCMTMPIVWGLQKSVHFSIGLTLTALIPLTIINFVLYQRQNWLMGIYLSVFIIIPLIFWLINLPKQATSKHYGQASRWLKWIMVTGVGSLLIYYIRTHA